MSEQNVEIVRRHLEAWWGEEPESALDFLREDVEFDTSTRPDGTLWKGRDGVRRAMTEWIETWGDYHLRFDDLLEAPDGRVALLWHETGRAKHSGAVLAQEGVTVFTLSGALISAILVSIDRESVMADLGLATDPRGSG